MTAMNLRQRRRLLILVNAALAAAAVACAFSLALAPLEIPDPSSSSDKPMGAAANDSNAPLRPLAWYAVIHGRDLRKPLYDPKPIVIVKPPPKPKPKPKLTVRLMGTAVEPGFTYGLFRTKSGKDSLVSVGESIEGAEVVSIADGSATVRFHGEMITLRVQKKGPR